MLSIKVRHPESRPRGLEDFPFSPLYKLGVQTGRVGVGKEPGLRVGSFPGAPQDHCRSALPSALGSVCPSGRTQAIFGYQGRGSPTTLGQSGRARPSSGLGTLPLACFICLPGRQQISLAQSPPASQGTDTATHRGPGGGRVTWWCRPGPPAGRPCIRRCHCHPWSAG